MSYQSDREAVLEALGEYRGYKRNVRIHCPLCLYATGKADLRKSLSVEMKEGLYNCFKCGAKGKLWKSDGDDWDEPTNAEYSVSLPEDFTPITPLSTAAQYLASREVPWSTVTEVGIGIGFGRIVVPIKDAYGDLLGWVGRSYPGATPLTFANAKYIDSEELPREFIVFNQRALRSDVDVDYIVVVEGLFDAL